jgi:hypothetical protein
MNKKSYMEITKISHLERKKMKFFEILATMEIVKTLCIKDFKQI